MIRRLLHNYKFCEYIDSSMIWGWKSQKDILKLENKIPQCEFKYNKHNNIDIISKHNGLIYYNCDESYKFHLEKQDFIKGVSHAYTQIYHDYSDKSIDISKLNYADPSLLYALYDLNSFNKNCQSFDKIKNINIKIIGSWLENAMIHNNDKALGIFSNEEIKHFIISGMVGPESLLLWDNIGLKQLIRVKYNVEYTSRKKRIDIFDWERDLMIPETEWQINNINKII